MRGTESIGAGQTRVEVSREVIRSETRPPPQVRGNREMKALLHAFAKRPMFRPMPSRSSSAAVRRVRLFRNGRNQAVRIPREFELPGEDAVMRKEGDSLIIEPTAPRSLLAVLRTLEPIDETFPSIEELAHTPVDL